MAVVSLAVRIPALQTGGRAALITAAVFLYFPLPFILRSKDFSRYGISWGTGWRGLAETVLVAVLILAPFYSIFFILYPPLSWVAVLPQHPWRLVFMQLLLVSLPEEFFFRAWLQTELGEIWKLRWKIPGAALGPAWIVTAAFFAAVHLAVNPKPSRALVFFPGLLFGWLQARTKSVIFPTILHAICNITFIIVTNTARL